MQGDLLVRGARIHTFDAARRVLDPGDILVRAGRITAIAPELELPAGMPVLDAQGHLAIPGLINAHLHSPGNLLKGTVPGLPLELFMLREVPPLAADVPGARLAYVRTLLGAIEMLKTGVTAVMDDAFHVPVATVEGVDAICAAYRDIGMRARVAIDQPERVEYTKYPFLESLLPPELKAEMEAAPRQDADALLALYDHLIRTWDGAGNGRIGAALSCSAVQRVTPHYLRRLASLSRDRRLPFNVHILETKLQRVLGEENYAGRSLVQVAAAEGALSPHTVVIHAIWVDDADMRLLADSGATVVHNPVCNMRLGSGVMPLRSLRRAGVAIALGTDEAIADDSINLWGAIKQAGLVHTLSDPDWAAWPDAPEILELVYAGGARALGFDVPLGRLEVGAAGDITLLDLDTAAFTPLNDVERQLVFAETGSAVRHVVVDGNLVVREGRVATLDERAIRAEARALAAAARGDIADAEAAACRIEPFYQAMVRAAHARDVGMRRRLDPP
jgi:5-methylthioadenosine/S-adenosylhomocysteine deaminase